MVTKIDFHTHYLPDEYRQALKKHIPGNPDGFPTPDWDPQFTLDFMKKHNIEYSVLSLSSPHINFGNKQETLKLAKDTNDYGAALAKKYPDKLGYVANLPIPYEEDCLTVIQDELDRGIAKGFAVPSNSRGTYFGSPTLNRVYKMLDDHHALVIMHPNKPAALPEDAANDLPIPFFGFFIDTTLAFMNMLSYHFFERFPNIKLVVPHGGAFLPILADRIAPYDKLIYHTDIYQVMKHVYFDVAGAAVPRQLPALLSLADPHHVLFGSDIPYTPAKFADITCEELETTKELTDQQRQLIFHDNGADLLGIK